MNSKNCLLPLAALALTAISVDAEPWTPAEIDTEFWLDAADASTITLDGNNRVSQWDDKSGNDFHVTQSRSDRRPTYSTTGWGGTLPDLQFASYGPQKDTLGRDVSGDSISGSAYTLFVVVDAQSIDGEEWIHNANTVQAHPAPGSENRHQINNNGVTVRSDSNNGGSQSGTYVAGQQILQFTLDAMASEVLRNGVQIAGNSGTYTPYALSGDFAVNGRNSRDGHAGMSGSLAEWIYLAANPSTEDRQLVEGYLAHKWGLADDLPSDHPYKNAAPGVETTTFPLTITPNALTPGNYDLKWDSQDDKVYDLVSNTDLSTAPANWPVWEGKENIDGTAPENTLTVPGGGDPTRFFAVVEKDPPPLLSEDFEGGVIPAGWSAVVTSGTGTAWEVGDPTGGIATGPPAAGSGSNCAGTNIPTNGGQYTASVDVKLTSPSIAIPAGSGATLSFEQFIDTDLVGDFGSVRILDAGTNTLIGTLETTNIGGNGTGAAWTSETLAMPAGDVGGKNIKIEFQFGSNADGDVFGGFYIDDVVVTAP